MGTSKKYGTKLKGRANRPSQQASVKPKSLNGHGVAHDEEMEQLRRELRRVTWELDFLKEAAAFLAKTSRQVIK